MLNFYNYIKNQFILVFIELQKVEDADDLTIETFAKAFLHLEKYDPTKKFSTWLFRIAKNTTIDFIKKKRVCLYRRSKKDSEGNSYSQLELKSIDTPEETTIKKQQVVLLKTIVNQLKKEYQILIQLRYYKEYSYEEIANELNLPLGTVKAKLHRARKALNQIIEKKRINNQFTCKTCISKNY